VAFHGGTDLSLMPMGFELEICTWTVEEFAWVDKAQEISGLSDLGVDIYIRPKKPILVLLEDDKPITTIMELVLDLPPHLLHHRLILPQALTPSAHFRITTTSKTSNYPSTSPDSSNGPPTLTRCAARLISNSSRRN
jgi:hypothetical protein